MLWPCIGVSHGVPARAAGLDHSFGAGVRQVPPAIHPLLSTNCKPTGPEGGAGRVPSRGPLSQGHRAPLGPRPEAGAAGIVRMSLGPWGQAVAPFCFLLPFDSPITWAAAGSPQPVSQLKLLPTERNFCHFSFPIPRESDWLSASVTGWGLS